MISNRSKNTDKVKYRLSNEITIFLAVWKTLYLTLNFILVGRLEMDWDHGKTSSVSKKRLKLLDI